MTKASRLCAVALALMVVVGCSKSYVVTRPLDEPLETPVWIEVGAITVDLPPGLPEAKSPPPEDLDKLRRFLEEEIAKRNVFRLAAEPGDSPDYELQAVLLEYKRGSGALRFVLGHGAGAARVTMTIRLVNAETGTESFRGNFDGKVSDWTEGGDKMFQKIARDFAKELEKQIDSIAGW